MESTEEILVALCAIVVLGTSAQLLAWRLRLPSIILLLAFGFVAGPVLGWLNTGELFGDLLLPVVSASVAIILFEGSLGLRWREIREIGRTLLLLLSVGALVTWGLTTLAARWVLGMEWHVALLIGAILVVTGPTVVGPLLRQIRPVGAVGPLARWEGIVIDPIGAILALLVFEAVPETGVRGIDLILMQAAARLGLTVLAGTLIGVAAGAALAWLLKRHSVADHLEAPLVLTVVLVAFAASNHLREESGLLAVTVMGMVMANYPGVPLRHILEFKENLSVLLISTLFIVLTARLRLEQFTGLGWQAFAFVAVLLVIVRPASVLAATIGSPLKWRERAFLAWLAPRGIVAAAVASVFALRLGPAGRGLVPAVFTVIAGTVIVYGLTSMPLARWLGLATANPQGLLIAGANAVARGIAEVLKERGIRVLLVDTNRGNVMTARLAGLEAEQIDVLADHEVETLELGGLGRFLAMTPNDEVNSLAVLQFAEIFGRGNVYQLSSSRKPDGEEQRSGRQRGRRLFSSGAAYGTLQTRYANQGAIKATRLTKAFNLKDFQAMYGADALPLFLYDDARLSICTADATFAAKPGQTVLALIEGAVSESSDRVANGQNAQPQATGAPSDDTDSQNE